MRFARITTRIRRVLLGPRFDEPHQCMAVLLSGPCTVIVAPGEGVRQSGLVFCTPEHALADQEEQLGP